MAIKNKRPKRCSADVRRSVLSRGGSTLFFAPIVATTTRVLQNQTKKNQGLLLKLFFYQPQKIFSSSVRHAKKCVCVIFVFYDFYGCGVVGNQLFVDIFGVFICIHVVVIVIVVVHVDVRIGIC